jgi:glycosyltransferase involved in cell wall biosynthesis
MLSVIICTHNPRSTLLARVLAALRAQTLPMANWELLLVDNASAESLAKTWDLIWHPRSRHIAEPSLGLTRARLRGISEACEDLLVFVDDDNIIDPDYLARAAEIAEAFPFLGAWGGRIVCEFLQAPPPWLDRYYGMLGRHVSHDVWSNLTLGSTTAPYGAGLCVRSEVARKYAARVQTHPIRQKLGRSGRDLSAAEDIDLAYTACEMNLGNGLFSSLQLKHIIPAERMTLEYFVRLADAMAFSEVLLQFLWTGKIPTHEISRTERLFRFYRELRQGTPVASIERARRRGLRRGSEFLRTAAFI